MVSTLLSGLARERMERTFQSQFSSSLNHREPMALDHVDLDFSDVFGPLPLMESCEVEEPQVTCNLSHSLVVPISIDSDPFSFSKLNLHEREMPVETGCVKDKAIDELTDSFEGEGLTRNQGHDNRDLSINTVGIDDFDVLKVVGQGAFGKVYQVRKKGTSEIYAMKVMRKDRIIQKNHVEYMKSERDILSKINHPFIVQLKYSFQTPYRLYLVLDFINGGHLFFQLYRHGLFREDLARVYTAEIVSAVSHLHDNNIMHRDLKPENILLDADGHIVLTDFGLAKHFDKNKRSNSMCGTVEYMAPEVILGKVYDKAADWWSIGILLFEMLTGKPPFAGGNRQKVQQKIIKDKLKMPAFLSPDAHSLLKGLLHKDGSKRLGSGEDGGKEVKRHKWFKPINWRKLEAKEVIPSFCPEVAGKHCISNFDKRWTDMPVCVSPATSPNIDINPFLDFTYVRPSFL